MDAYVMVGAPGAGKSTYAKKLAEAQNAVTISGDDIRYELYGSVEVQPNWTVIWDEIERRVEAACGLPVILDGTHFRRDYRAEAVTLLRSFGYTNIEAIVLDASLATCLARNFQRADRNVPDYTVKEMHEQLQRSLKGIHSEDFDFIRFIY